MIRIHTHSGLVLLALCGLASAQPQQAAQSAQRPKNVLVIVLDDLGTDKLGFYGETPTPCQTGACTPACAPAPYALTPNLDALRRNGILFTNAYTNPVCSPTRACILTGRYGFRTGIGTITGAGAYKLPDHEVFLPELLRDGFPSSPFVSGLPYRSAAFGKWHLTWLTGNDSHAVDNGFDRFYGSIANLNTYFIWTKIEHDRGSAPQQIAINGSLTNPPFTTETWQGSITRRDAVRWINNQQNAFFAYVCFNPPHFALQVPPLVLLPPQTQQDLQCYPGGPFPPGVYTQTNAPMERRQLFYRAMVEGIDAEIGNMMSGIDPQKLANTMVFVIGDNGTPDYVLDAPPHDITHAKSTVYEWGIRVPLIVSGPLVQRPIPPGGHTSAALVQSVDLWRTIAAITGADEALAAPQLPLDSISFLPVIRDLRHPGDRRFAFTEVFEPNGAYALPPPSCYTRHDRAISNGAYKYIRKQLPLVPCATPVYVEELYDIRFSREEPPASNLIGTSDPFLLAMLAQLRNEMTSLSGN
jgi:arylsulfatase A-like enzyme